MMAKQWTESERRTAFHRALAANIGNVLEWYDFAVYGYLASTFGKLFFVNNLQNNSSDLINANATATLFNSSSSPSTIPASPKGDGTIEAFAVFGGAFLMRPLGGILLGKIGDTMGRKKALELSIVLMASATFLLGCLPTRAQAGVLAPLLLIVFRLIQGLSVGGQLVGSFVFTIESAPPDRRAIFGGMCMATAVAGTMLGSVVGALLHASLSTDDLETWGWRIPFLSGILVGCIGLKLQHRVDDSPEFIEMRRRGELSASPFWDAMRHPWHLLLVSAVAASWCSAIYVGFVWLPEYMQDVEEPPVAGALIVNSLAMFVMVVVFFPFAGTLADRHGVTVVIKTGALLMAVGAPIGFALCNTSSPGWAFLGQLLFAIGTSAVGAALPTWMIDSFSPQLRYSAVAVGYNVAQAIFGGLAPAVSSALVVWSGTPLLPAVYMSVIALLSFAAICWSTSGKGQRYLVNANRGNVHDGRFAELSEVGAGNEGGVEERTGEAEEERLDGA